MSDSHSSGGHGAHGAPGERLGGKHLVDDALQPLAMQALSKLLPYVKDTAIVQMIMEALRVPIIGDMIPVGLNVAIAKYAKSSEAANFVKDAVLHTATRLNEMADEKGGFAGLEPKDFADAIDQGYAEAAKASYVKDPDPERAMFFHRPACPTIAKHFRPQHRRQGGKDGKDGKTVTVPGTAPQPIELLSALKFRMHACPVCIPSLNQAADEDAAKAKAEHAKQHADGHGHGPKVSAMEILHKAGILVKYMAFVNRITDSVDRQRVQRLIAKHLNDRPGETGALKALLELPDAEVIAALPLLVDQGQESHWDEFFGHVLDSLTPSTGPGNMSPAKRAVHALKGWDEGLTDEVAAVEKWAKQPPKERPSLLGALFNLI